MKEYTFRVTWRNANTDEEVHTIHAPNHNAAWASLCIRLVGEAALMDDEAAIDSAVLLWSK